MAVMRVERTRDYTIMSNFHLKDRGLSLKSKGLLSLILSLPDEWQYSTRGLAAICKEGVDAIGSALRELEAAGYIIRNQLRDSNGRITDTEYVIYEHPQKQPNTPLPDTDTPDTGKPYMDSPDMAEPYPEKPAELITNKVNKYQENTDLTSIDSIPFRSDEAAAMPSEAKGNEAKTKEIGIYRDIIRENIDYEMLRNSRPRDTDRLNELVELMTETVCSKRKYIRVAGSDFPHDTVKSRLLKLDGEHINFVLDCLDKNTSEVRNIKQYLLATLFNAPTTIGNYYFSKVNHDLNHDLE